MTDNERLEKLQQAVRLLREVEFSYEVDHPTRRMFYAMIVEWFSLTLIGDLMTKLKEKKWKEQSEEKADEAP